MTPEQIAAGLTKAQREAFAACQQTMRGDWQFWCADWRTAKAILRKGLIEGLDYKCSGLLTPIGLAVRAILEQETSDAQ